jgi:hypothetical protein
MCFFIFPAWTFANYYTDRRARAARVTCKQVQASSFSFPAHQRVNGGPARGGPGLVWMMRTMDSTRVAVDLANRPNDS